MSAVPPIATKLMQRREMTRCAISGLKLDEMGLDCFLVPFKSYSRHIGYMQQPIFDRVGSLENWIGPVLPLQPMCRLCDAQVRA
jgi:hypothetical protein